MFQYTITGILPLIFMELVLPQLATADSRQTPHRANSDMKISPIIIAANVLATVPLSAAFSPSQSGNASIHKKRQSKVSKTSPPAMFVRGGGDVVLKNFYGDALGERYYTMINMNICCLVC